jgi:NagD protein
MPKAYLIDMDGVLIRGNKVIPGAIEFIEKLKAVNAPFLVLTNNSRFTPRDHQARLQAIGLNISAEYIFTSALATARFLDSQRPHGSAFVIGEAGLTTALHEIGYVLTEHAPEYVVLGETFSYSFEQLTKAVRLIDAGARFIATNPDIVGPTEHGAVLACGAVAAMITAATGVKPYFVGKPNPLMMRSALRVLGAHSEDTVMIGDRMDTDIVAGLESGMQTILVLSGVTASDAVDRFPYKPGRIVSSVADIVETIAEPT